MSSAIEPPIESAVSDVHVRLASIGGFIHAWQRGRLGDDETWRAVRAYVLDAERGDDE